MILNDLLIPVQATDIAPRLIPMGTTGFKTLTHLVYPDLLQPARAKLALGSTYFFALQLVLEQVAVAFCETLDLAAQVLDSMLAEASNARKALSQLGLMEHSQVVL